MFQHCSGQPRSRRKALDGTVFLDQASIIFVFLDQASIMIVFLDQASIIIVFLDQASIMIVFLDQASYSGGPLSSRVGTLLMYRKESVQIVTSCTPRAQTHT